MKSLPKYITRCFALLLGVLVMFGAFLPLVTEARSETYGGVTYNEGTMIGPIGQEVDSTGWSAARVIWQVSQWYGINPQVILATMQKESSLITSSNPPYYLPMWAMGYAYTDGGIKSVCVTSTNNNPTGSCAGFPMQVDWAAGSLKYYQSHFTPGTQMTLFDYQAGANRTATPANGSTYSLYKYTPYVTRPNTFCNIFNNTFGWSTGQDCSVPTNPTIAHSVINDNVFTNSGAMSQDQIQALLVSRGSWLAGYTVPSDNTLNVYRFYNLKNGSHFYTASVAEKNSIVANLAGTYRLEGVAYADNLSNPANSFPLYRFYNFRTGTHFYTASESEKNNVIARMSSTYRLDGVAYYVSITGGVPVYRFYTSTGTHFYTASEAEKNNVIAKLSGSYRLEGVAFYVAQ